MMELMQPCLTAMTEHRACLMKLTADRAYAFADELIAMGAEGVECREDGSGYFGVSWSRMAEGGEWGADRQRIFAEIREGYWEHRWEVVWDEPGEKTWRTPSVPGNRVWRCYNCDLRTEVPKGTKPEAGDCWRYSNAIRSGVTGGDTPAL